MKKINYLLILFAGVMFIGSAPQLKAQTFESQIVENDMGYLVYQMRETSGTNTPITTTDINDITFVIRYPSGALDMDLICSTNDYNISDGDAPEKNFNGYDYHYWNAGTSPAVNPPHDWTVNEWEDIAVFYTYGATGSDLFEVAPDGWDGRSLNWNQTVSGTATDFTPTIPGSGVTYSYPTLIYDLVWTGEGIPTAFQDAHSWSLSGNWKNECGGAGVVPTNNDNCYIPGGLTNYPENNYSAILVGTSAPALNVRIGPGGKIDWGIQGTASEELFIYGNLDLYDKLTIRPNARVTVDGDTYIEVAEGLVVEATSDGVGSFIDNGTINYGTNGTAKVQTFISNGATGTNFWMHFIGPTVDAADYTGTETGVLLGDFEHDDLAAFVYEWDETVISANGWVNIYDVSTELPSAKGIALSTNDATDHTINITGELLTGTVASPSLTYNNNHYELISNPYPSAIDFDLFYANTGNGSVIENKNWIWDAGIGNYLARADGAGDNEFIQVGQGFFVETLGGGTVDFENTNRTHSTDAFRDVMTNILTLNIAGGGVSYSDELIIRFKEGATSGYDIAIEAIKWNSMYAEATMIRSIAGDGTELAINVLPQLDLQGDMVSVPVHFQCGYEGEYTFTAGDLESFEYGTEIWIEDKQDANLWHHFSPGNETYTFTADPDDAHDRFIIHFFGPTSVGEIEVKNVLIYAYNEYAHIRNMTKNEIIKEIYIYSLAGTMIMHEQVQEQSSYRFFVSNHHGYYVVRVVTDKNIYTEKVFVH